MNHQRKRIDEPMLKLIPTSPRVIQGLPLLMLLMLSMSWTGCKGPRVIAADQMETRVEAGKSFTPPADGWFLNDARYQRYRRAVADRIQELQKDTK